MNTDKHQLTKSQLKRIEDLEIRKWRHELKIAEINRLQNKIRLEKKK